MDENLQTIAAFGLLQRSIKKVTQFVSVMIGNVAGYLDFVLFPLLKTDAVAKNLLRQAHNLAGMAAGVVPFALPAVGTLRIAGCRVEGLRRAVRGARIRSKTIFARIAIVERRGTGGVVGGAGRTVATHVGAAHILAGRADRARLRASRGDVAA